MSLIYTPKPSQTFTPISDATQLQMKASPYLSDNPQHSPAGAVHISRRIIQSIPGVTIMPIKSTMMGLAISYPLMDRREKPLGAFFCKSIRELLRQARPLNNPDIELAPFL